MQNTNILIYRVAWDRSRPVVWWHHILCYCKTLWCRICDIISQFFFNIFFWAITKNCINFGTLDNHNGDNFQKFWGKYSTSKESSTCGIYLVRLSRTCKCLQNRIIPRVRNVWPFIWHFPVIILSHWPHSSEKQKKSPHRPPVIFAMSCLSPAASLHNSN